MLPIPAAVDSLLSGDRRLLAQADTLVGNGDLNTAQASLEVGGTIPIIFAKRISGAGGVWVSPLASECRFENDLTNRVTASYHCVLCAGQLPQIQIGDIYQGDTPIVSGEFIQAYNARAGTWTPGNFIQQRFNETTGYQEIVLEGKEIGDKEFLDINVFTTDELAQEITNAVAVGTIKSSGEYVTSFTVQVSKTINWPESGMYYIQAGPEFQAVSSGGGGFGGGGFGFPSLSYYESLAQKGGFISSSVGTTLGGVNIESPFVGFTANGWGYFFTVTNKWIYDRGNQGRFINFSGYSYSRSPSIEPSGTIEINIAEQIRGGFLTRQTAIVQAYDGIMDIGKFGGLPAVTYTFMVNEVNNDPLPKPEATLHCGTGGTYSGLTTLSVTKQYPAENEGWRRQIHLFARNGTPVPRLIEGTSGPSNLFPDLARFAWLSTGRVDASQIDDTALLAAARFNAANDMTCDGIAMISVNVAEWVNNMAPLFLLRPTNHWGKLGLRPAIPVTSSNTIDVAPITPAAYFNESNILPNSFKVDSFEAEERNWQVGILTLWREQPETNLGIKRGSGPFRFAGVPDSSPIETVDASEWVTRELHATRLAALELARRRYITHRATIAVEPSLAMAALIPGCIVRLDLAINPSVGRSSIWSYYYTMLSIGGPPLGPWTVELEHHPINQNGVSMLSLVVAGASIA